MRIIDISVLIEEGMVVFPGEPQVSFNRRLQLEKGDPANVSFFSMGCHTATHVDSPAHFFKDGPTVESLSLDAMMGNVFVCDVGDSPRITADQLCQKRIPKGVTRILFKTKNSRHWGSSEQSFDPDFVYLEPGASRWVADHAFKLVGIDYLSVDALTAKKAESHMILLGKGIIILEGINLSGVQPGVYEMCCLPLRLHGLDAAPARVVLIER